MLSPHINPEKRYHHTFGVMLADGSRATVRRIANIKINATIIETNKLTQSRWDFYLNDPFGKYITLEKDDTEYVLKIKFGHRFIVRNLIRNKDRIDDTQHEYRRLLRMMIKHK